MPDNIVPDKTLSLLEEYVVSRKGRCSIGDAVSATGLSYAETEAAFYLLLERYECRAAMNPATGTVEFVFAFPLERRNAQTFGDKMRSAAKKTLKVLQRSYRAALGIMLVGYAVILLVVLIVLAVPFEAFDAIDFDLFDLPNLGAFDFDLFDVIDFFRTLWDVSVFFPDQSFSKRLPQGALEETPQNADQNVEASRQNKKRIRRQKIREFIESVYRFVLGEERPLAESLVEERGWAEFIRANGGALSAGHIAALAGSSFAEAESKLIELAGRFKGEVLCDDDGLVRAEFPVFTSETGKRSPPRATSSEALPVALYGGYWDVDDKPLTLAGNTSKQNALIIALNTFNLVGAVWITVEFAKIGGTSVFLVGLFPILVALLYFLIPIARIPFVERANRKRKKKKIRRKLAIGAVRSNGRAVAPAELFDLAGVSRSEKATAQAMLEQLAVELQAEITLRPDGVVLYAFRRLAAENAV